MKKICIAIFIGVSSLCANVWGQDNPLQNPPDSLLGLSSTGKMSREQAIFDLEAMIYTINEVHPNMYAQCKMADYMRRVEKVKENFPDSLTVIDLYREITPLVSMLGDGHTSMAITRKMLTDTKIFPVDVKVNATDSTVTVHRSSFEHIPEGAQILSINDVPTRTVIEHMMNYKSGERPFFKLNGVSYDFPFLLYVLYKADSYELEILDNGVKKTETVSAVQYDEYLTLTDEDDEEEQDYSYEIPKGKKYAVMTFNSCEDPERMAVFADSMVTELNARKIKYLIVDVRNNGGGYSSVGDELLKRISSVPFKQFGSSYIKITPTTQELMKTTYSMWGYDDFLDYIMPVGIYYDSGIYDNLIEPLDYDHRFHGKVILLTSHGTFSSAAAFSWAFKYFNVGAVVGEETGGMNVCFGDVLIYTLPVSHLWIGISHKRFWQYGADETDIHGTLPDYDVPASEALDFAKELIKTMK